MTSTTSPPRPAAVPAARAGGLTAFTGLPAVAGGRRYAVALLVDALGAGLLRPFLLLYGVGVIGMSTAAAGLAMSCGMLAGLAAVPFTGRWIDRGARTAAVATTLLVRSLGTAVLLMVGGRLGFFGAAALLGIGGQSWPGAHTAVVATLTTGRARDAALAAGRSLRNAGLGAGALLATLALAGGTGTVRLLAAGTGLACLVAAALVWSMRLTAEPAAVRPSVPAAASAVAGASDSAVDQAEAAALRRIGWLSVANLPFAFCFDVLEVALPAVLLTLLHTSAAWSSGIFVGNTVLVITLQVAVVRRLAGRLRRSVLAAAGLLLTCSYLGFWAAGSLGGGLGAGAVVVVSVLYTGGEILYAGTGPALVVACAPPRLLGRALARWEVSMGAGRALAPAAITALISVGPGALWGCFAGATLLAALAVARFGPAA